MNWSTCWISREERIQHSVVPMISSTFQRSPWKTCGLFDTGFAGDVDYITSTGLNAPVAAVNDYDPLSDLGPAGHQGQSLYHPSTSAMKVDTFNSGKQLVNEADTDSLFGDLDPDLSGDPLGDDSMEAFINLDKFLNGNSFFDEEGNLTVPEDKDVQQEVKLEAEVAPVIHFAHETAIEPNLDTSLNFTSNYDQDFLLSPEDTTTMTVSEKKPSRKRKAGSREGVKTSLYEIPAESVIPEFVHDNNNIVVLSDTELDHDYSTKRQRMSLPNGNDINTPSTSGAMRNLTQHDARIPKTVGKQASKNVAPILDDSMDKQTIRRIKNNHASKRSREQRKQKFVDMDMEAEELVVRNQQLREKIVELEKLAKEMKAVLVAKMAGKAV